MLSYGTKFLFINFTNKVYNSYYKNVKLPGEFQLENISAAIATARQLTDYKITNEHIKVGITRIESIARLQELKSGKLKNLASNNLLFVDGL